MSMSNRSPSQWIALIAGPVLSLVAFVVAYFLDPLHFGARQPLAAIPSFLLAIVILLVGHNLAALRELERASLHSDRIYEAVKDYLHVTKVGSPESAMQYVLGRLPILQEIRNTTFSLPEEVERSEEKLYDTPIYATVSRQVAEWAARGVIWKDIGDSTAVHRLREILARATAAAGKRRSRYQFRLITHNEPQINFILLSYPDASTEVLFNWDFRNIGEDPVVLLSRDRDIVEMFAIQFEHLWRVASVDHDNTAVTSTSNQ
jgi:HEPN domain-containing protein